MTDDLAREGREGALLAEIADLRDRLARQTASAQVEHDRLSFELGHRVKNTLGVVQALASQTLRTAASPQEAMDTLNHRIIALANANDAILREGWTSAGMRTVAQRVLTADAGIVGPLSIEGSDLRIDAGAALSFCMALHELAANARRHGAWLWPEGRVDLAWTVDSDRLLLGWTEQGGPPIEAPAQRRFGLRLIEQSLRSAFGRDVTLTFDTGGLRCRVVAPLAALTRRG